MTNSATERYRQFVATRRGELRRIAARTQGEHTADDLASEAWLLAIEIGHRRGWNFDFANEDDQDTLLAWMHNAFVRYANKVVRNAIKLDRDWDDDRGESAGAALARLLTAPMESDPHAAHQAREQHREFAAIVRRSYSEAAAYVVLLIRVDWHIEDLASMLWIGVAALRARLKRCGLRVRVQPSLFDGVATIDSDFVPTRKARQVGQACGHARGLELQSVLNF